MSNPKRFDDVHPPKDGNGKINPLMSNKEETTVKIKSIRTLMISLAAIGFFAGGASASRLTAGQLAEAGFDCFEAGPSNWTHCLNLQKFGKPAVRVLVFSEDGSEFLGTEQLLREDIYAGQPCPQDGLGSWDSEAVPGYFACHHFSTGHH